MAPSALMMSDEHMSEPVSRTFQYRKYMKPMLERKRRARINRCLDELKELMTGALQNVINTILLIFHSPILTNFLQVIPVPRPNTCTNYN